MALVSTTVTSWRICFFNFSNCNINSASLRICRYAKSIFVSTIITLACCKRGSARSEYKRTPGKWIRRLSEDKLKFLRGKYLQPISDTNWTYPQRTSISLRRSNSFSTLEPWYHQLHALERKHWTSVWMKVLVLLVILSKKYSFRSLVRCVVMLHFRPIVILSISLVNEFYPNILVLNTKLT